MATAKKRNSPRTWTPRPPGRPPTAGEIARLRKFMAAGAAAAKSRMQKNLALAAELWAEQQRAREATTSDE